MLRMSIAAGISAGRARLSQRAVWTIASRGALGQTRPTSLGSGSGAETLAAAKTSRVAQPMKVPPPKSFSGSERKRQP
jgi:hypothetical protein